MKVVPPHLFCRSASNLSAHLVPRVVSWLNFDQLSVNQLGEQVLHVLEVGQLLQELLLCHVATSPVQDQVKVGIGRRLAQMEVRKKNLAKKGKPKEKKEAAG